MREIAVPVSELSPSWDVDFGCRTGLSTRFISLASSVNFDGSVSLRHRAASSFQRSKFSDILVLISVEIKSSGGRSPERAWFRAIGPLAATEIQSGRGLTLSSDRGERGVSCIEQ